MEPVQLRKLARVYILCSDITMSARSKASDSQLLLRTLAEFCYELRKFLHFSERAAVDEGLQPQQHQLLLQVADAPEGVAVTIAFAAERLSLRHHSVVELVNRSEREGFLHGASEPQLGSLLASYGKTRPAFCVSDQTGDRMANLAAASFESRQLENRISASIRRGFSPACSGIPVQSP